MFQLLTLQPFPFLSNKYLKFDPKGLVHAMLHDGPQKQFNLYSDLPFILITLKLPKTNLLGDTLIPAFPLPLLPLPSILPLPLSALPPPTHHFLTSLQHLPPSNPLCRLCAPPHPLLQPPGTYFCIANSLSAICTPFSVSAAILHIIVDDQGPWKQHCT